MWGSAPNREVGRLSTTCVRTNLPFLASETPDGGINGAHTPAPADVTEFRISSNGLSDTPSEMKRNSR